MEQTVCSLDRIIAGGSGAHLASPRLASPRLPSPRITSTSPSLLPLYPFPPPFVHLPLLVFRSFPTLTCFSPEFFSFLSPPLLFSSVPSSSLPTDPVEKGINIGRDETRRYESGSDFTKVSNSSYLVSGVDVRSRRQGIRIDVVSRIIDASYNTHFEFGAENLG